MYSVKTKKAIVFTFKYTKYPLQNKRNSKDANVSKDPIVREKFYK